MKEKRKRKASLMEAFPPSCWSLVCKVSLFDTGKEWAKKKKNKSKAKAKEAKEIGNEAASANSETTKLVASQDIDELQEMLEAKRKQLVATTTKDIQDTDSQAAETEAQTPDESKPEATSSRKLITPSIEGQLYDTKWAAF